MRSTTSDLKLRPASLDDSVIVADLETARDPDDPRDPEMLRFWWSLKIGEEKVARFVAENDGAAVAFAAAGHRPWNEGSERFGWVRMSIHPSAWSEDRYRHLIDTGEGWLREQGARISTAKAREDFGGEIAVLVESGYREVRRAKEWELDLVEGRKRLLAAAAASQEQMEMQGVRMHTLDRDDDPDRMAKLYELDIASMQDIPTTVPHTKMTYDEWHRHWFDDPATRTDRFWIARGGAAIVGLSVIGYPPVRGLPWTFYTAVARTARGRGIARALKYQTVAQAIALGATRVRTSNDGENAPILHLNAELGYHPIPGMIEMHRELRP